MSRARVNPPDYSEPDGRPPFVFKSDLTGNYILDENGIVICEFPEDSPALEISSRLISRFDLMGLTKLVRCLTKIKENLESGQEEPQRSQ